VPSVRSARFEELQLLQVIEQRAGSSFRALDMTAVAEDDPPSLEHLGGYQRAGHAWVAEHGGEVVGYLLVDVAAGSAHVEQVSVDPAHAGRRIGQQLLDAVAEWAREQELSAITLTTFELVPWNAPYYTRLGFAVVPTDEQSPQLRAIRSAEVERGLDAWPRVAMCRRLG